MKPMNSQHAARLIHTGQVIVDLVMQVDALPTAGGDVLARGASFEVGGGFNVMAAARRSGMPVVYVAGHGCGRFGEMARQALAQEGVEIASPVVEQRDTGLCVAIVDASAERTFVSHMGAESELERAVLDGLAVTPDDIVYVSGYSLMLADKAEVLMDWLERLPSTTRVAFDPGPLVDSIDATLLARMLAVVTIWSSNRVEAMRFAHTENVDAAFDAIVARLKPDALVIVRDGEHGCYLLSGASRDAVPGFTVEAIDSNGAGDAHAGVFLAVLASTADARTAARRANAAAAIAVTRRGPATAPGAAEIDTFVAAAR